MSAGILDSERPISETYADVEEQIKIAIRSAIRKWGGDWDDWHSLAHEVFMKAYDRWRPNKGRKFDTWLGFFLNVLFTEKVRRETMRAVRLPRLHIDFDDDEQGMDIFADTKWRVEKFLMELGDDAKMVTMLVLDPPLDLKLSLVGKDRHTTVRDHMLEGVAEFLTDIGWDSDRIYDTFQEITDALC